MCTGTVILLFLSSSLVLFLRCVDGKEGGMCCKLGVSDFLALSATTKIIPPKPQRFIKSFHELESIKSGICAIFCILSLQEHHLKRMLLRAPCPHATYGGVGAPLSFSWLAVRTCAMDRKTAMGVRKPIDLVAPIIETHRLGTFFGASFQKCKDQEVSR